MNKLFVFIFILFIGILSFSFLFYYVSLENNSDIPTTITPVNTQNNGIWAGQQVIVMLSNPPEEERFLTLEGVGSEVKHGHYTVTLLYSDYEQFATIRATNTLIGISHDTNVYLNEPTQVLDLQLEITGFINSPCPPGVQC